MHWSLPACQWHVLETVVTFNIARIASTMWIQEYLPVDVEIQRYFSPDTILPCMALSGIGIKRLRHWTSGRLGSYAVKHGAIETHPTTGPKYFCNEELYPPGPGPTIYFLHFILFNWTLEKSTKHWSKCKGGRVKCKMAQTCAFPTQMTRTRKRANSDCSDDWIGQDSWNFITFWLKDFGRLLGIDWAVALQGTKRLFNS
jgi:hypothetical protein